MKYLLINLGSEGMTYFCDDQISQVRMRRISASRCVVDVILRKADASGMTTYTYEMNQIQALSIVSDMSLLGNAFEDLT